MPAFALPGLAGDAPTFSLVCVLLPAVCEPCAVRASPPEPTALLGRRCACAVGVALLPPVLRRPRLAGRWSPLRAGREDEAELLRG